MPDRPTVTAICILALVGSQEGGPRVWTSTVRTAKKTIKRAKGCEEERNLLIKMNLLHCCVLCCALPPCLFWTLTQIGCAGSVLEDWHGGCRQEKWSGHMISFFLSSLACLWIQFLFWQKLEALSEWLEWKSRLFSVYRYGGSLLCLSNDLHFFLFPLRASQ